MCSILLIAAGLGLIVTTSGLGDWIGGALLAFMALGYLTGSLNNPITGRQSRREIERHNEEWLDNR